MIGRFGLDSDINDSFGEPIGALFHNRPRRGFFCLRREHHPTVKKIARQWEYSRSSAFAHADQQYESKNKRNVRIPEMAFSHTAHDEKSILYMLTHILDINRHLYLY